MRRWAWYSCTSLAKFPFYWIGKICKQMQKRWAQFPISSDAFRFKTIRVRILIRKWSSSSTRDQFALHLLLLPWFRHQEGHINADILETYLSLEAGMFGKRWAYCQRCLVWTTKHDWWWRASLFSYDKVFWLFRCLINFHLCLYRKYLIFQIAILCFRPY